MLYLLSNYCFANEKNQLNLIYNISYQPQISACFDVKVMILPQKSGKFLLRFPSFGQGFQVSPQGSFTYEKTNDPYIFLFDIQEPIQLSYQACNNNRARSLDSPIIESDFFHFYGSHLLALPVASKSPENANKSSVKINFSNLPQQVSCVSSYGANNCHFTLKDSIENLQNAIFAGGEEIKTIYIKGHPVTILTKGSWQFFKKDPSFYIKRIIETQRRFWNDFHFPYYAVILMQDNSSQGNKKANGRHENNLITALIPDGNEKKLPKALALLSHEAFHAWLGFKMKVPLEKSNLQWLLEGVTNYYGLRFVLASKLISKNAFLDLYNEFLEAYYLSPVHFASNQEIADHYVPSNPYYSVAMFRGHFVFEEAAPTLNQTQDTRMLDNAMREIYQIHNKNEPLTESEVFFTFSKYFGKKKWQMIRHALNTGAISHANKLENHSILTTKKIAVPQYGFDVAGLIKNKKITSVEPESKAFYAGLRDGQEVIKSNLPLNAEDKVQIVIVTDNKQKIIHFKPEKMFKDIPQYKQIRMQRLNGKDHGN